MTDPGRQRWNLVLGRFAEDALGGAGGTYGRMARALDYVYEREYRGRGMRIDGGERTGSGDPSALTVPDWITEVHELFPSDVCETVTTHALERYDMKALVTDPRVLEKLEPSYELLRAVLTFRGLMQGKVLDVARRIVRQVVEDLRKKLESEVRRALIGRVDRHRRSRFKQARNLDLVRTIRRSLKHYDPETRKLSAVDLHFFSRQKRHVQWDIILCVDCSGSMLDSVIHSAVMAGIFHALPSVRCKLVAFDTAIVDLSDHVDDPVEVLMSVQLGGGTDIGGAMQYCAGLVEQPTRTIVVLVTDFYEGGSPTRLLATIKELAGAGVRACSAWPRSIEKAQPVYDHRLAAECAAAGADVAALTPQRLTEWVAAAMR